MRLFLLPISTRRALIYCQRLEKSTNTQKGLVDRITNRAAVTWSDWEAKESGWQKKVTEVGNRLLQGIPYEEWGLKSIPALNTKHKADGAPGTGRVEVVFPDNILQRQDIPTLLRRLGTERQSLHQRRAWWSIAAMPLTIPVAVLPVIPNLPFFYLVFRSWSHFRALNGSKHLVYLVENNLLEPNASPLLEDIYTRLAPRSSPHFRVSPASIPSDNTEQEEQILLNEKSHSVLAKTLEVPELANEVERAVKQVRKALNKGNRSTHEKGDIEKSDSKSSPGKR